MFFEDNLTKSPSSDENLIIEKKTDWNKQKMKWRYIPKKAKLPGLKPASPPPNFHILRLKLYVIALHLQRSFVQYKKPVCKKCLYFDPCEGEATHKLIFVLKRTGKFQGWSHQKTFLQNEISHLPSIMDPRTS